MLIQISYAESLKSPCQNSLVIDSATHLYKLKNVKLPSIVGKVWKAPLIVSLHESSSEIPPQLLADCLEVFAFFNCGVHMALDLIKLYSCDVL